LTVSLPPPVEITGPWTVDFESEPPDLRKVSFEKLDDWSKRPEPGIKSLLRIGHLPEGIHSPEVPRMDKESRFYLDLGTSPVMASVKFNGRDFGVAWNPPYRFDVTAAVNFGGQNVLEVKVVNLWVNRLIGDEQAAGRQRARCDGCAQAAGLNGCWMAKRARRAVIPLSAADPGKRTIRRSNAGLPRAGAHPDVREDCDSP